jgi:hypothetical protein
VATVPEIIEIESETVARQRDRVPSRKKLVRRHARDRSQALRFTLQPAFLLLNVTIGLQFFLFVRYFESGGRALRVPRPAGVDGWLPIGGMMNLKYFSVRLERPRRELSRSTRA